MATTESKEAMLVEVAPSDSGRSTSKVHDTSPVASNWNPGYRARFPAMGFFGLLGVVICTSIIIAVLVASDNVSSSKWSQTVGPSIIINGFTSISGLCLALAIAEGVSIAWWRKALKGATVAELHKSWEFRMSFTQILRRFWALDVIALAALAAKLAILDAFFFQRATTTYTTQDPAKNVTMLGITAKAFPQTGFVVSPGFGAQTDFMIGDTYTPTVDTWETSNGFFENFQQLFRNCDGVCYTHVDAIGFEIECQKSSNHTNYATGAINAYNEHQSSGGSAMLANLDKDYSRITMDLLYFDSDDPYGAASVESCPGTITNVQCTLCPALVRYPLTIVNYTNAHITNGVSVGGKEYDSSNTITPPIPTYSYSLKQADGFKILSYLTTDDRNIANTTTQLGGVANALSQFLSSTAAITYSGSSLWGLSQRGTLAQTMMFGPPNMGSCDCSFHDALSTLVAGINQLTFLTATALIQPPAFEPIAGTQVTVVGVRDNTTATFSNIPNSLQISDVIHYHTHYLYLALGVSSTIGCLLLILPAFWRYGVLGREVTLGPMEIASAFRAPVLETGHGEDKEAGNLKHLIKHVGERKVMYGYVEEGAGADADTGAQTTPDQRTSVDGISHNNNRRSVRLAMEEPAKVKPLSGVWESGPQIPRSPVPTSPRIPE
ncbi:hypothetical protein LTR20_009471 [Exophiala xenobiotica]|nr:hypothetical protein LTR93_008142 [Exophiala xenobiotica]KAK5404852.1 hypothetical protein LTR06_009118 [Exophiala xenobiotica]KAK5408667.1 hypothetical protein LTR90_009284 [Exophiala xenobiotica]KAK5455566.1 hypothetical protein LTR20_009471 [Exophiala xenobiotica]KAK5473888.1 hypothetical protein LTR26_009891 [Exophiala xenobiotica]